MTGEQIRISQQVARQLWKLATIAGDNELLLGNGGEVGSILGSIAAELDVTVETAKAKAIQEKA